MAYVTVYFEADPSANIHSAAQQVIEKSATLPNVKSATAEAMVTHNLGPQEIMMGIQMATNVMTTATAAVGALTALIAALQKLADEVPALNRVMVQVGLKKVPAAQLTEQDIKKLAGVT